MIMTGTAEATVAPADTRKVVIFGLMLALWNALGLISFVQDFTLTPDALARMPANEAAMFTAMPGWQWVVYGVGTTIGLLGALAMIARRAWAVPLSLICLVAVVIQFFTQFLTHDATGHISVPALGFGALILVIAAVQFALAWRWRFAGLLRA